MKHATLAIILNQNRTRVLLGKKHTGEIGRGTFNGPGGKRRRGESSTRCVFRETREELGVLLDLRTLRLVAMVTFYAGIHEDFFVHVYRVQRFMGTPKRTLSMSPQWFAISKLPYRKMLESDREWFKKAVRGERFRASIHYRARAKDFERIHFSPLR